MERESTKRKRPVGQLLTYMGKTQTFVAWAKELGIKRTTLATRIKWGWTPEKAIETPVREMAERKKKDETREEQGA